MKTITTLLTIAITFMALSVSFGQKVAIVGISHDTSEGFTFVATQDLLAGEQIRFTDNEYDAAANVFTFGIGTTGEFVVTWVATAAVTKGTVFYVKEGASNSLTITCSSGTCGTITWSTNTGVGNGAFSFASDGDSLYAYADTNDDPRDAIGEIYSVMYTDNLTIPANESPLSDWPNAIVTDGFSFPVSGADRIEFAFSPASQRDSRTKVDLENPTNYVSGPSATDLSIVPFTNFNLVGANPVLSIAASPTSVNENSGTGMVYTFTLDAPAVGAITANFNVSGTATFTTDYIQSGAASFNASTGTVTIPNAATTATVTLTPVGDTTLEPDETAILTLAAGTGYTAGSPSSATGTILNDDTLAVTPLVAVTGGVHTIGGTEGFSFVALDDIAAGTEVFFTENVFDNNLLRFTGAEAVVRWIAPAGGVLRGEVIVATEGPANVFTTTCNSGTCGSVTLISGVFDYASNGEALFAYTDTDTDHTNGITAISAVLFTGTSAIPGGNIPAGEDPSGVYVGSVVVDGFPASPPIRTEYKFPPERGVTVDQANFQNVTNWFHAQPIATLSTVPFANIIITTGSSNPTLTLTASPTTTVEDSGTGMVYTFMLDAAATADITVNFTVSGTATFTTDYTVSGAATFSATSGTAVILNGNNSVAVTVTPVADALVEPTETVELMIASGTGYDGGSPNSASGSITNDDTSNSDPLVAITGMNHITQDGFSFVAAQDIPAGTTIYFTENAFDNTTLLFGTGEGVFVYTSPGTIVPAGDVIVIKETSPNVFSLTCNGNTGAACGLFSLVSGNLAHDTLGETLYAYEDSDNDPSNGVDDIYAVMFTGLSSGPSGGSIPASQDPSGIYLNALVIDGFPATNPDRTEYRFALGERGIPVGTADFENTAANWLHGQPNQDLSPIPFANLSIVVTFTALADLCVDAGVQAGLGGGMPAGGVYSGPGVTDDGNGTTYSFDPAAAGVGVHTLTYTSGGGSAMDDVEVFALPTVTFTALADLCIDAGVQVGLGGGSPNGGIYSGAGVTDDGNGMTYSFDPAAAGVGTHTLTYTFTDANGCTASASDDVEVFALPVVAFTAPADLCIDAGVQAGLGGGTPTGGVYSGPGVTDDGNGMTYSFDPAAAGVGTHTLTYTFTDANGCTDSASDDVEVFALPTVTFTAPADLCVDEGVQAGLGGGTPNGGIYSGAGVTDDGNGMTYSFDPAAAGVGTHTLTYTFTDANGCTDSASDDVEVFALPTVTFTAPPSPVCPGAVLTGQGGGTPSGGVYSGPGVTDDGNGTTYTFDAGAAGNGTHTLTYTFTDANGCTGSASDTVTVEDTQDPVVTCPTDITQNNDPGVCGAVVTFTPTATDNCPGVTVSSVPASGSVFPVGITTVTVTATDASGNTDTCTFDVTVNDTEDPTITCPADITVNNDPGVCGAVVTFADPTVADNCGGTMIMETFSFTGTTDSFVVPAGVTSITIESQGAQGGFNGGLGASISGTFAVTPGETFNLMVGGEGGSRTNNGGVGGGGGGSFVWNTSGPTLLIAAGGGGGGAGNGNSVPGPGSATNVPTDSTNGSGNGAGGAGGNGGAGGALVAAATCEAGAGGGAGWFSNGADGASPNAPLSGGGVNPLAGGAGGNEGPNCTFPPTGSAVGGFGGGGGGGGVSGAGGGGGGYNGGGGGNSWAGSIPPGWGAGGGGGSFNAGTSPTNTGGVRAGDGQIVISYTLPLVITQTAGLSSGSTFPIGTTTNTFLVTDPSGNTATCSFDVTVTDNEPPVANCVAPFTLQLDATGNASITPADIDNGSTDNCGIASLAVSPSTFTCADVGPNTVTLTVTDVNGNSSTCTTMVTIEDNVAPTAVCMDITIDLDADGNATITPADVDGGSTDACGIASLSIDVDTFDCSDVGPNNVVLTVTDVNGNSSQCTAIVTVQDVTEPIIACPADIVAVAEPDICGITLTYSDPIALDACGVASVVLTSGLPSGSVFPVGVSTVEWTATDVNGNSSTCSFTVTVTDTTPPVAVCQDITVPLDATGNATITVADVDGGSFDNCAIDTISIDIDTFDCSDVGPNDVTLTVTDIYGNVSSCIAVVTIEDVTAPVAVCQNITVQLDATGTVTINPADLDGGSTDVCGIDTAAYSVDIDTFDCSNVGDNPVVLTVTDVNGNTATCTAIVTVEDITEPDVVCQDITVELDENGLATIVADDVIASNTDACGIFNTSIDISEFNCDDIGTPVLVTVFSEDVNGNISTCTAEVTVVDLLAPVVTCPADQTVDPGGASDLYEVPDYLLTGEATAIDNCTDPLVITTQDPAPGTLLSEGTYTVTITAEDESGNIGTCTFELTVDSTLGTNDPKFDISTIIMYPNPAQAIVNISNPQAIPLENATIYDVTGRLVKTFDLRGMGTEKALDIATLASATYVVVIQSESGTLTKQLIKE
tara:strand:+ start:4773 stop:12011 length:7239 start_codon:yes stop_codon:yes gene_type:complete